LHYQPIIDTATREVCGLEALIRWNHPVRGVVMPREFIPIAESTGLIVPLGEAILRQACADATAWPADIKIAVNLSPVQFGKGSIVETITRVLSQTGLAPERLELEITESVLLRADEPNVSKLHQLKALGVSIVLDDFGTGYSSLSYLRMFPFDKIKIDRSFVGEITTRSDCAAIVTAIIGLARCLDMVTTAEGVETVEQFELLRIAGCGQVQGYLFGPPAPISQLRFDRVPIEQNARVA
jgi:EAL domain-containing protein (putative c-di-GMP-specific phosphodiesterase class I)